MNKYSEQQAHWISMGMQFGYPPCCIMAFVQLEHIGEPERKLHGTGFIPCKLCNEEFTEQQLVDQINKHRFKKHGKFMLPSEEPLYFIYGMTELGRMFKEVNVPMGKQYAEHMCDQFNHAYVRNRVNVKFHISPILDI